MTLKNLKNKKINFAEPAWLPAFNRMLIFFLLFVIMVATLAQIILTPNKKASFSIVITGDMQGNILQNAESSDKNIGYEGVDAYVRTIEEENGDVILLDAGDCLGGSELAEKTQGHGILEIMNTMTYDALTLGSRDLVYGMDTLSSLRAEAKFPFLAANIKKAGGSLAFEKYKIISCNGFRVAIVGVTDGIGTTVAQRYGLTVTDMLETVRSVAGQLKSRADFVVVMAYTDDQTMLRDIAGVSGVDLVVTDGELEDDDSSAFGIPIVASGSYGKKISRIDVDIDREEKTTNISYATLKDCEKLTASDKTHEVVKTVYDDFQSAMSMVMATLDLPAYVPETEDEEYEEDDTLWYKDAADETESSEENAQDVDETEETDETEEVQTVAYNKNYKNEETAVGDLVADAMLSAASADGPVAAVIEACQINGMLYGGTVTYGELYDLFNDNVTLVTCQMTGGEIRSMIEDSFDYYPNSPGFLQVSGLTYTYSTNYVIGSHLSDVTLSGSPMDDARVYVVAMTDTLARERGLVSESTGLLTRYKTIASVVSNYIQSMPAAIPKAKPEKTDPDMDEEDEEETSAEVRINIQ